MSDLAWRRRVIAHGVALATASAAVVFVTFPVLDPMIRRIVDELPVSRTALLLTTVVFVVVVSFGLLGLLYGSSHLVTGDSA